MLTLSCVQINGLSTVYKQQEPADGRNVQNSWLIKAGRMQAVGPTGRKPSSAQQLPVFRRTAQMKGNRPNSESLSSYSPTHQQCFQRSDGLEQESLNVTQRDQKQSDVMNTEVSPVKVGRKSAHTADCRHLVVETVSKNTKGSLLILHHSIQFLVDIFYIRSEDEIC